MKIVKLSLTIIIALAFAVAAYSQDEDPDNHIAIGDEMPEFEYQTADGKVLKSEDLFGKVVLINFYASWCGPCKKELPHVEKDIYNKYIDNDDFCLLVIARQEGWDKIKAFKKSSGFDLPFYPDPKRDIYKLFAEKYIPRNYLFDKQGKLVLHSKGFIQEDFDVLKKEIKELL